MRHKRVAMSLLAVLLIVSVTGLPLAQIVNDKSTVIGTPHDTSAGGNGCLNCHVPHQTDAKGRTLLWAQNFSTETFGTYSDGTSTTLDGAIAEVGDPTYSGTNPPSEPEMRTVLCMSCHDGVTSTLIISTDPHAVGSSDNDGLRNDHPVNIVYDPVADTGLNPVASVTTTNVRLFQNGATQETVQCASCHDPHGAPGVDPYLRLDNANSGLCVTCHK